MKKILLHFFDEVQKIFLCLILISGLVTFFANCNYSFAKIIQHDVYQVSPKKTFSLQDVCKTMLKKEFPLLQAHSATKVDCMSRLVDSIDFCEKKLPADPYLASGFVDSKNQKVVCQSARRVVVKYACEGSDEAYCKDSSAGCNLIKSKLARRLDLSHHSLLDSLEGKKELNCYFSINNLKDL